MKIEQEIKQRRFKDEYHKLVVNLQFTSNWLSARHSRVMKQFGISAQQYNVLRILKGQYPKPSSLILIRERMLDKESNASRLIDKLVAAEFVKRIQCENDRRQVDITITQSGLDLLEKMNPTVDDIAGSLKSLSETDAQKLNELLDRLRDN